MKSLRFAWNWSLRDLKNNPWFAIFFILNFAVGLSGFVSLDSFKRTLEKSLNQNAKLFLSADFAVSARRKLTDQEVAGIQSRLPKGFEQSKTMELFSMVSTATGTRLVGLKAIDNSYPFYGDIKLKSGAVITSQSNSNLFSTQDGLAKVWPYQELLLQLGAKVGDKIKLGKSEFVIQDAVVSDSTQTFRLAALAPRVYLSLEQLMQTGLVTFGSTLSETYLFKFDNSTDTEILKSQLEKDFRDPNIRFSTPKDAAEDGGRVLGYLLDYLGLASLVALFLAGLGTAYLFRTFLSKSLKNIAILNAMGLSISAVTKLYLFQTTLLGLLSALISGLAITIIFPLLNSTLASFSPLAIVMQVTMNTILVAVAVSTLGAISFCYPLLRSLRKISAKPLLQESAELELSWTRNDFLWILPGLFFYWGLAIWQSNSWRSGTVFTLAFLGCLGVLGLAGLLLQKLLARVPTARFSWQVRYAILSINRKPYSNLVILVSVGLASLLLNLMPQLKTNIQQEIEAPRDVKLPSLFLFDIQDEQVKPFEDFVASQDLKLNYLSPMVRGRIVKLNGIDFERSEDSQNYRTREEEANARSRNRGVNISYRHALADSESVGTGILNLSVWRQEDGKLPELSIEEGYAERMKLSIGDKLSFDIQGIEVEAVVSSLRKVKWNSFQPNFFILIQPGVFDDAPKTFLGALPKLPPDQVVTLQNTIVDKFPNVSMVDVDRVVKNIFEISEKMSWSLIFMAMMSFLAGFMVLYSISNQQIFEKRWDLNMLKILGASTQSIFQFLVLEFLAVCGIGAVLGIALSILFSHFLAKVMFGGGLVLSWVEPLVSLVAVLVLTTLVVIISGSRIVRQKSVIALNQ